MSVRHWGTLAGALLISSIVVACSATDATSPRLLRASYALSSSTCSQAPTITYLSATPSVLSPADHQMVTVNVSWGAVDDCGSPMCSISSVTSNQNGNGQTDIVMLPGGTSLSLLAKKGNVYTITVTCTDASGNKTSASTTVTVPKKSSKCAKDDNGQGDDKNGGDVDVDNKCKHSTDVG